MLPLLAALDFEAIAQNGSSPNHAAVAGRSHLRRQCANPIVPPRPLDGQLVNLRHWPGSAARLSVGLSVCRCCFLVLRTSGQRMPAKYASRRQRGNASRLRATDTRHRRPRRHLSSPPAPGTEAGASICMEHLGGTAPPHCRESHHVPTNATTNATTGATRSQRCGIAAACALANPIVSSATTVTSSRPAGGFCTARFSVGGAKLRARGGRRGFDLIRRLRS